MTNDTKLTKKDYLSLYTMMKRIRMTETMIENHYGEDQMHTPIHLYIGQEAVAAGVCFNLDKEDVVFSNHRNHGHYIAKGGNLKAMIAELFNKETGCAGGFGGSMHLIDQAVGFPLTSAIVAGGIPLATGHALAASMRKEKTVTVAFLGDAATEEGVVYESICFAVLKNLPIVYVCENNYYSVGTPLEKREREGFLSAKFTGMLPVVSVDGNDVLEVQRISNTLIEQARCGGGPSFLECKTYRLRDHHNVKTGVEAGYQSQNEWDMWAKRCPLKHLEQVLLEQQIMRKSDIKKMEEEMQRELDEAFDFAQTSKLPAKEILYNVLFEE